ncbi:MAG: carotenoid 1,2-hydratase [Rhodocyclaceae bacterium]|nr:carotenoid 1,2-hydratase [Rhodocyclaceae bacterium]
MRQRRRWLAAWMAGFGFAFMPPMAAAVLFPPVTPRRLVFPRDHGAHADFRSEWWYVTGWLDGPHWSRGFQLTFFRVRTGHGEDNPSRFSPRQLLIAHAAIADPALARLRHAQRSARADGLYAGFRELTTDVWIGEWFLRLAEGRYQLAAKAEDFALALELDAASAPLLHGATGFSQKAPDARHASFYYSRPQLALRGLLTLGRHREAASGVAWVDHEWSSELLPEEAQGWEWVGLNFDDGSALMAFRLRRANGEPLWAGASFRDGEGRMRLYGPSEICFVPLRIWRSPRTQIAWPVEWLVSIEGWELALMPLFDDQEFDARRSTGAIYWEGAVRVKRGARVLGRGYLELTGYGDKIRVGR